MQNSQKGFGLIEVLVALAVIAGAALLVSQFVLDQSKGQIQVREKSSCDAAISSVISKFKEKDNNANIVNWLPKAGEVDPPSGLATRMAYPIATNYKGNPLGQVESVVGNANMGNYITSEINISQKLNNYQLIESATSILTALVRKDPGFATGKDARSGQGFLADTVNRIFDSDVNVDATINVTGTGCIGVPINVSTVAGTNTACSYGLSLTAKYRDPNGNEQSCTQNASFSSGSDLQAPTVETSITPLGSLTAVGGGVLCGQGISRARFQVTIRQNASQEERGVQYLCRLDYLAGLLPVVAPFPNRTRGTGWFLCSMPEASIAGVSTGSPAQALAVTSVDASSNTSVSFQINDAAEGSYRLHVKAIDTARNESPVVTQDIRLDLTRPTINQADVDTLRNNIGSSGPGDLNVYRFQCSNRNHARWNVAAAEAVPVSSSWVVHNYRNNYQLRNPRLSCAASAPATPTAYDVNEGFATPTAWTGDGPKTADFLACDICSNALSDPNPSRADALWFVDTQGFTATDLTNAVLGSPQRRFIYSAGPNDTNPYLISHRRMGLAGGFTDEEEIYNFYNSRVQTAGVIFSEQSILHCEPYGNYSYSVRDGCSRTTAKPSHQYTSQGNTAANTLCSAGGGANDNTRFCPNFLQANLTQVVSPLACAPPYIDCGNLLYSTAQGLCGDRASGLSCKFRVPPIATAANTKHRSCQDVCTVPVNLRPKVGNRSQIAVGEVIPNVYNIDVANCPTTCDSRDVVCQAGGVLSDPGYRSASCTSGEPCACQSPKTVGPFSTSTLCEASADDCEYQTLAAGYCGEPQAAPVCPPGTVECTNPGVGDCPSAVTVPPNLHCKPNTCSTTPYAWTWPSGRPTDGSCVANCVSPQSPQNTYTQFCQNGSGVEESGCCANAPETCKTCTSDPVPGVCNPSAMGNQPSAPTSLCTSGDPEPTTLPATGPWSWTCKGSNHPANSQLNCTANQMRNGQCGGAAGGTAVASFPTSNHCSDNSDYVAPFDTVATDGTFNWTCPGTNAGNTASCSVPKARLCWQFLRYNGDQPTNPADFNHCNIHTPAGESCSPENSENSGAKCGGWSPADMATLRCQSESLGTCVTPLNSPASCIFHTQTGFSLNGNHCRKLHGQQITIPVGGCREIDVDWGSFRIGASTVEDMAHGSGTICCEPSGGHTWSNLSCERGATP